MAVRKANAQAFALGTNADDENLATAGALSQTTVAGREGSPADAELAASAQARRRQPRARRPAAARGPAVRIQAFGEIGWELFAASKTFDAVLGSKSGLAYGGGARIAHRSGLFGQVDITRFTKDGSRVFVSNGEVFSLGIPTTVTTTPIDFTVGIEAFANRRPRPARGQPRGRAATPAAGARPRALSYYVGGGLGLFGYKETAEFATAGDDTDDRFRSYHVMGGVHVPVWSAVGVGFDVQRRWVKDAIGTAGVSQAFEETDLGGLTVRVRFTVGM